MKKTISHESIMNESKNHIATGYNSPFRSFDQVGGTPIIMASGKGSKIVDINNKKYIDYSLAWGPLILGHTSKSIQNAIKNVSAKGWCLGTPTISELEFAKKIKEFFPSMELIRLTNSGTEAVMSAIRLARGYTKKEKIIIFNGSYHGHSNDTQFKIKNNLQVITSAGIPEHTNTTTIVAEYNSIESVEAIFTKNSSIAAILIEPISTNMGLVLPKDDFLKSLKLLCERQNCLLIFDEVVSGFRASKGGAQELYNIKADITILGKSLAGGLPVGAFGARREIMEHLSPMGDVYSAGTFSGNPLTVNCGIATLQELQNKKLYADMINRTTTLCTQVRGFISDHSLPVQITNCGSMFCLFFTNKKIVDYSSASSTDVNIFARYFHHLLENGIYISPSAEDTCFMSTAHSKKDVEYTVKIITNFLTKEYLRK